MNEQQQQIRRMDLARQALDPSVPYQAVRQALAIIEGKEPPSATTGYLSAKEACAYAGGISRTTLWAWGNQGLTSYKVSGRALYRAADIDKFVMEETDE